MMIQVKSRNAFSSSTFGFRPSLAITASLIALASGVSRADEQTWTATSTTNWGTATNWSPAAVPANGDFLKFTNNGSLTTSNNNLAGFQVGRIVFGAGRASTTVSGNSFTLLGDGTGLGIANDSVNSQNIQNNIALPDDVEIRTVGDLTLSGVVSGAADILKTGAGTLNLTGVNTFSQGITISDGTVSISGGFTRLADTVDVTVVNGSFSVNNGYEKISDLNLINGSVNGTGLFEADTYNLQNGSFSARFQGAGTLTKSGPGWVMLSTDGTNSAYSGATVITGGTLQVTNKGLGSGALTIDGGQLQLDSSDTVSSVTLKSGSMTRTGPSTLSSSGGINVESGIVDLTLDGSSGLTKTTNGTVTLAAVNTYAGATTINGGTLVASFGTSLGSNSAALNFGGIGSVLSLNSSMTRTGAVNLSGDAELNVNSGVLALNGTIGGTGWLTKSGAGNLSIGGSATHVGGLAILQGQVSISGNERLNDGNTLAVQGGSFSVGSFTETVGDVIMTSGSISGSGSLIGSSYTVDSGTISTTLGGTGALTKNSAGTVDLSGANTYTGATTVNAGALRLIGSNKISDASALIVNGGAFDTVSSSDSVASITMTSGSILGTGTLTAGAFNLQSGTVNAKLAGAGAVLTKTGAGLVTMTGDNSYTGGTNINAGTLRLTNGDLGTGQVVVNGGTLDVQVPVSLSVSAVTLASGSLTGTTRITSASSFDLQSGAAAVVLAGTNGVIKSTGGTVTLSKANEYTGNTLITGGTLVVTGAGTLGSSSNGVTINDATLSIDKTMQQGSAGIVIGPSGATIDVSAARVFTALGGVSGLGLLTKTGSGTFTIAANSTYSGGTTVSGGTLNISGNERLFDSGNVVIDGGTLSLSPTTTTETVNQVTMNTGAITGSTATLVGSAFDLKSGSVSAKLGGGALTKTGAGTVTLAAANSYTGATTVIDGALALTGSGAIDSSSELSVAAAGAFDVSGKSTNYVYAGPIINQGLVKGGLGPNVFEVSGNVSGAGDYLGNMLFSGDYGPGNSPALVTHENTTFAGILTMELGGLARGAEYDAIDAVTLNLGGTLKVDLIDLLGGSNLFAPVAGNTFDLLVADTITGMFDTFDFMGATLASGLSWSWSVIDIAGFDTFRLLVLADNVGGGDGVPSPSSAWLLMPGLLMIATRRRRRLRA